MHMQTSSQQLSRLALHLLGLSSVPGIVGFPGGSDGKSGLHPWITKITWRREWLPTPVFLPGEFHGQRRLLGYSPRGRKELDMIEGLTIPFQGILFLVSTLEVSVAFKYIIGLSWQYSG